MTFRRGLRNWLENKTVIALQVGKIDDGKTLEHKHFSHAFRFESDIQEEDINRLQRIAFYLQGLLLSAVVSINSE